VMAPVIVSLYVGPRNSVRMRHHQREHWPPTSRCSFANVIECDWCKDHQNAEDDKLNDNANGHLRLAAVSETLEKSSGDASMALPDHEVPVEEGCWSGGHRELLCQSG
jgi:hypothetical protein